GRGLCLARLSADVLLRTDSAAGIDCHRPLCRVPDRVCNPHRLAAQQRQDVTSLSGGLHRLVYATWRERARARSEIRRAHAQPHAATPSQRGAQRTRRRMSETTDGETTRTAAHRERHAALRTDRVSRVLRRRENLAAKDSCGAWPW